MWEAIGKIKGTESWRRITNYGDRFAGERGITEFLVEKMGEKYPNIEYKLVEVK